MSYEVEQETWEFFFKRYQVPCFLADRNSHELLYINPKMEEILGVGGEILGKKFTQVLKEASLWDDTKFLENLDFDWENQKFYHKKVENVQKNQSFDLALTIFYDKNSSFIFGHWTSLDEREVLAFDFEKALSKCLSVLNLPNSGELLLKILGEFYDGDKACLYFIDREHKRIINQADWCKNQEIIVAKDLSRHFSFDKMVDWYENHNELGVLEANKLLPSFQENSLEAEILEKFSLDRLIQAIISDSQGMALGVVAVANVRQSLGDFRLLQCVGRFLESEIGRSDAEFHFKELSDFDLLTGFRSRSSYSQKIEELTLNPPKTLGVIFANVNGLRKINGEFGFAKGDTYIKMAAETIQDQFDSDFYRISGDEFISFLPDVDKETFEKKIFAFQETLKKEGKNYFAIGHAWHKGRFNVQELIKISDTVMYINKQEYYHSSQQNFQDIKDSTLSDLLSYLENGEFMVYFQPQVLLSDGSLYGAEALIRRFDKTNQKMVFPDEFIPLYEKKSVIRHVDIFVVEQVCALLQRWEKDGHRPLPISVNLSRVTLQEYGIVASIDEICQKYGINRQLLVIEVTERVGLIENNVASSLIKDFQDRGFRISLDDFGCAYSNIVTLAQIQVDEVKLDKSLVDFVVTNEKNQILVKNVLAMCNELKDTSTLAEGIEEEAQATLLHSLGCHLGQGYYYSRPIPLAEFCEKYHFS